MDMALGSNQGTSIPTLQGQRFVVGQRMEMPAAIGATSTSRNYKRPTVQHLFKQGGFLMLIACQESMLIQVCKERMAQKGLDSTLLC